MEEDQDYFDDFDDSILGAIDLDINSTIQTTNSSSNHHLTKTAEKLLVYMKPNDPINKRYVSKISADSTRQTTFNEFKTHQQFVPKLKFHIPVIPNQKPTYHKTDQEAIKTWIYPTNYPKRDYQHAICQSALFSNTLVCLPTGLGKTFIAAVVMFNFFRWFPKSKIVFLAPTKPLVNQQIDACYKIVGIPAAVTVELTGTVQTHLREKLWKTKNLLFMTPETFRNDIQTGVCPSEDVVLIVFDEAHRASGNYAYCDIIREMTTKENVFRVLALSATPGSDGSKVQDVVNNLLIQQLQLRTEESDDVVPFIFKRSINEVVLEPSPLLVELTNDFSAIIQPYLKTLVDYKVYNVLNPVGASKFGMIMQRDGWRKRKQAMNQGLQALIEGSFAISITLLNILEKLSSNGVRSFYEDLNQFDIDVKQQKNTSKMRLALINNPKFIALMSKTRQRMSLDNFSSHPKMDELLKIVMNHFEDYENEAKANGHIMTSTSKIMIFSNYRSSVDEIVHALAKHSPLIRPAAFIGQANSKSKSGLKQKDQLKIISDFQQGIFNVVVATSIGEEGLDIGEIDIIICYDVHKSPIRMLQRCGRTGRKRAGQIYLLMSKGVDEDYVKKANLQYKSVQKSIISARATLYDGFLAGVLPEKIEPICDLKNITITYQSPKKLKSKEQKSTGAFLPPAELKIQKELYFKDYKKLEIKLNRYPHWQAQDLKIINVPHGAKYKLFVGLMNYFRDLKNSEKPQSPALSFNSLPSLSQRSSQPKNRKRRKIKNLLDSVESENSILSFEEKKNTTNLSSSDIDSKDKEKVIEKSVGDNAAFSKMLSDESGFGSGIKKKKIYVSTPLETTDIANIIDERLEESSKRKTFENTLSRRDLGLDTLCPTPFGADNFDFYDNDDNILQREDKDVLIGTPYFTEDDLGVNPGLSRVSTRQNGRTLKCKHNIGNSLISNNYSGFKAAGIARNDNFISEFVDVDSQYCKNEFISKSDNGFPANQMTPTLYKDPNETNFETQSDINLKYKFGSLDTQHSNVIEAENIPDSDYIDNIFVDFPGSGEMVIGDAEKTQDLNQNIVSVCFSSKISDELEIEESNVESEELYNELDLIDYDNTEKKCVNKLANPALAALERNLASPLSENIIMPRRRRVINDSSSPQISAIGKLIPMTPILEKKPTKAILLSSSPQINTKLQRNELLLRLQQKRQPRKPPKQRTHISTIKPQQKLSEKPRIKKPKNKIAEPFIDIEAEVSSNGNASSDEISEPDADLSGFIDYSSKNSPGLGLPIGFYRKSMLSPELGGMGKITRSKFHLKLPGKALQRRNSDNDDEDSSFVNDEIIYDTQFGKKDFDDDTSLLEEGPGTPVDIDHLFQETVAVDGASEASIDDYIDDDIDLDAIEVDYMDGDADFNEMHIDDLIDL